MKDYLELHLEKSQIDAMSNLALAHMGDGVFELLCRGWLCCRGDKQVGKLHADTVALVRAGAQARFAEKMLPMLTEEELSWYRRGKNSHVHAVPKGATAKEYAMATGLEALFGRLWLEGRKDRINALFTAVMEELYGL